MCAWGGAAPWARGATREAAPAANNSRRDRVGMGGVYRNLVGYNRSIRMRRDEQRVVLDYARRLHGVSDAAALLEVSRDAVARLTGYHQVWIVAVDREHPDSLHLIAEAGNTDAVRRGFGVAIPREGDAMIEEILTSGLPVVVEDARTDPRTNKEMVARFGNRTIINIPLLLHGNALGAFGVGTFGEEGVRPPTEAEMEVLVILAAQLAGALDRLDLLERQRQMEAEREQLLARFERLQGIEALGLLAGGIAHDFNNLLSVLFGALEPLSQAPLDAQKRLDLQLALDATRRARLLTRQLLGMGGRNPQRREKVDVARVIASVEALVRRLFPADIGVQTEVDPGVPGVLVDPGQLEQVLLNLCLNARDAMPTGGRLELRATTERLGARAVPKGSGARAGWYVTIAVKDSGTGMSPEVLKHLFEPFFTTKGADGTGLGMMFARGIVEKHGGFLTCTSTEGAGSCFVIHWPVDPTELGEDTTSR